MATQIFSGPSWVRLKATLPRLDIAGACCSGVAEVHSVFSAATKQQALYIDAPWMPALECCYELATKHRALVVDSNVAAGSEYEVVSQAVDCVRFKPRAVAMDKVLRAAALTSLPLHLKYVKSELDGDRPYDTVIGMGMGKTMTMRGREGRRKEKEKKWRIKN